ncbi:unnamed protein product [Calicophoron daubneyi]|uniref:Uncharacterized protein n=1 Tax=Calicophoron daubneyi TaxID=300641 RepID=A0AAV2T2Y6_CALDB
MKPDHRLVEVDGPPRRSNGPPYPDVVASYGFLIAPQAIRGHPYLGLKQASLHHWTCGRGLLRHLGGWGQEAAAVTQGLSSCRGFHRDTISMALFTVLLQGPPADRGIGRKRGMGCRRIHEIPIRAGVWIPRNNSMVGCGEHSKSVKMESEWVGWTYDAPFYKNGGVCALFGLAEVRLMEERHERYEGSRARARAGPLERAVCGGIWVGHKTAADMTQL